MSRTDAWASAPVRSARLGSEGPLTKPPAPFGAAVELKHVQN